MQLVLIILQVRLARPDLRPDMEFGWGGSFGAGTPIPKSDLDGVVLLKNKVSVPKVRQLLLHARACLVPRC